MNASEKSKRKVQPLENGLSNSDIYVNVMCFIRDTAYQDRYIFNQPVIISPVPNIMVKGQLSTRQFRFDDNIPLEAANLHSETTLAILLMIMVLSLCGAIFLIIRYYRRKSKSKLAGMTWEMNNLYRSIESVSEQNNNEESLSILPRWLKSKPEMIYPAKCIEQGQALGHGQYGTVYKGKLNQGNAV